MPTIQELKHVLDVTGNLQQVCAEIFNKLSLSYFCYTKVSPGKKFVSLTTNPTWTEQFYQKKYYNIGADSLQPNPDAKTHDQLILWDLVDKTKEHDLIIDDLRENSIHNLCSFVKATPDTVYIYHFGVNQYNLLNNQVFLNNREVLMQFVYYFQNQLHQDKTLLEASHLKLSFDDDLVLSDQALPAHVQNKHLDFQINRYYVDDSNYITSRELECVKWIALGKSLDEVALILNLSKRTVETHINNLKRKLDCEKITYLISKLWKMGLFSQDS